MLPANPGLGAKRRTPTFRGRCVAPRPTSGRGATHRVKVLGVSRLVPVSGSRAQRIAEVARLQRGCIGRSQLRAVGVANGTIGRLVARGQLIRVRRGVYAVGHAAPTPLAAETAALLTCGEDAVLSHHTAARLRGLLPRDDDSIHVTVPKRHGAAPPGIHVHRAAKLTPADVQVRERLPITSTARTLLDLAEVVSERSLRWAVDEALQQRLVSLKALLRAAEQPGRHGARALRRAAERHRATGITRSAAEKRFLALVRAARLPEPRTNVKLHGVEVDAYWPEGRLVVEVDSYRFHYSRPKFERDSAKGATLVAAGLGVMRVTWYQMEEEPFAVVARLTQALTRGALH